MLMVKIRPNWIHVLGSGLYWNFSQLPDGVTTALSIRGYSVPECFSNPAFPGRLSRFCAGWSRFSVPHRKFCRRGELSGSRGLHEAASKSAPSWSSSGGRGEFSSLRLAFAKLLFLIPVVRFPGLVLVAVRDRFSAPRPGPWQSRTAPCRHREPPTCNRLAVASLQ